MAKTNEEHAVEVAKLISSFVNNFGCDEKTFVSTMLREHRTLQQSFTRLCVMWLEELAKSPDFDLRNEASVLLARRFVQRLDHVDRALPFV